MQGFTPPPGQVDPCCPIERPDHTRVPLDKVGKTHDFTSPHRLIFLSPENTRAYTRARMGTRMGPVTEVRGVVCNVFPILHPCGLLLPPSTPR